MNPILSAALGSIIRWALALGAGYLVKAGIWTGSDAETYVTAGALGLLGLGWSLWSKYHGRLRLLKALEVARITENEAKTLVKAEGTPPVSTHPDSVPLSLPPT